MKQADRYVVGFRQFPGTVCGPELFAEPLKPFRSLAAAERNAQKWEDPGNTPIIYRLVPVRRVRAKRGKA